MMKQRLVFYYLGHLFWNMTIEISSANNTSSSSLAAVIAIDVSVHCVACYYNIAIVTIDELNHVPGEKE